MASNSTQRPGKAAPWGLLSPGVLWLVLIFLVPVFSLFKMALSSRSGSRFAPPTFDWNFGNFADAFSQYGTHFLTSFAWAGMATIAAILIGYPLAYTIAAYGGRFKDLLIGLVVVLGARQIGRDFAAFLVDVVGPRRHVRIDAKDREGPRPLGHVRPGQLGIAVAGQCDPGLRIDPRESVAFGNDPLVGKGFAVQFHGILRGLEPGLTAGSRLRSG